MMSDILMKTLIVSLFLSSLVSGSLAFGQDNVASVETSVIERSPTQSVLLVPGTVISRQDASITSELNGRLTWIAEVGDEVQVGDPLAKTDDHLLQLQLRNDDAQISRLKANLDWNDRQIERLQRLASMNNAAASEIDAIKSQRAMLQEELRMAEIAKDRTLYDLQRSSVQAPFSGIVVSRSANSGEYTGPGQPLLRLVNTVNLEVSAMAPLRIARHSKHGQGVVVSGDEQQLVTPIRKLVPVADETSHMMEVRVSLAQGQWFIGEPVTVELTDGASATELTVPRDALVLRNKAVYVFTVDDKNIAHRTSVITGTGAGNLIAITGNLSEGDSVIVRGAERLKDGQTVRVIKRSIASL